MALHQRGARELAGPPRESLQVVNAHVRGHADLWPKIRESVQRNGQEEAFIAPFFTQLDEVTLGLITPDGAQQDDVQYTFRKAA